jgi:hypothetical protein
MATIRRSQRRDTDTGERVTRRELRGDEQLINKLRGTVTTNLIDGDNPQTWPVGLGHRP